MLLGLWIDFAAVMLSFDLNTGYGSLWAFDFIAKVNKTVISELTRIDPAGQSGLVHNISSLRRELKTVGDMT